MSIVASIGKFILKIFLGGLFNRVMSDIENAAQNKEEAARQAIATTEEAYEVEKAIIKKQAAIAAEATKSKPENDPMGVDGWNQGK